jgi:membrane AbrB-like protein
MLRSARLSFPVSVLLTLLLALAAALLCLALRTPLPWMIGPLLGTALISILGGPVVAWAPLRDGGFWAIGTALGLYFTPQVVQLVAGHWGAIVLGIVWAFLIGACFGAWLRRVNGDRIAGLDQGTTYCASAIGGASEMALLAERIGARVDLVASAHSLRVLLVVLMVPFAFQFSGITGLDGSLPGPRVVQPAGLAALLALTGVAGAAFHALRLTNPWMLGPLLAAIALTASGHELSALPVWLSNAAQLVIGVQLGVRFTPSFAHSAPRWLATVALGTVAMILASAAFAWALAALTELHPASVMLGTAPGGISEMCITAKVLQLGVPVVTAFHVTRMLAVVLLAGPVYRWWYAERSAASP